MDAAFMREISSRIRVPGERHFVSIACNRCIRLGSLSCASTFCNAIFYPYYVSRDRQENFNNRDSCVLENASLAASAMRPPLP